MLAGFVQVITGVAWVTVNVPLYVPAVRLFETTLTERLAGVVAEAALTAEQAQSYKPRMKGFEFMFDTLGCGPEDVVHCSSSCRYDLMTAHDLGIKNKVWVNRGHEPANPYYGYVEIKDIGGLPGVLGL